MYVRKSLPTLSAVALDSSSLDNGTDKALGRVKITADAAGDIGWDKIVFTVNLTSPSSVLTTGATSTMKLWQGSNIVAGNFATTTGDLGNGGLNAWGAGSSGGTLAFLPTSEQSIAAGESATYELRGTVGSVSAAGGYTVNVSVANPSTTASTTATAAQVGAGANIGGQSGTPSFTWSDKSSIATVHGVTTSDWTDDYLVKNLPLTIGTLSKSI